MTAYRPLSLSTPNVRAALAGEKFTIGRKVAPQPGSPGYYSKIHTFMFGLSDDPDYVEITKLNGDYVRIKCPFGPIGTWFWVREQIGRRTCEPFDIMYLADQDRRRYYRWEIEPWEVIDLMPREYSRLNVVLLSVTVEQIAGVWRWIGTFGREA